MSTITSLPTKETHQPPAHTREGAHITDMAEYQKLYEKSLKEPEAFWKEQATAYIDWVKAPTKIVEEDLAKGEIHWFADGELNVTTNCLDRHLEKRGDKTAILWEADEPGENRKITYKQLHAEVCQLANELESRGIKKGDRVIIYMGMVPELATACLACARIGAVHSVIFGGFSSKAISDRVEDAEATAIITQNEGRRGGKAVPLKANVDKALENVSGVDLVLVYKRTDTETPMKDGRDVWWQETVTKQSTDCEPVTLNAEDPLFILYTSGSTGKPKGVLHTQGGYLLWTMMTHKLVFDLREDDVYCCAADVGWITGHSYIVYGPLGNGATSVMFESTPVYPDPGRYWDMIQRLKITQFYTAPTAIRALMRHKDEYVTKYDRSSLRVLGTVGEPINPEAWRWYFEVPGEKRCSIVDTYWQTETGGHVLTGLAGATPMKPGSASFPFFGIDPCLVDENGKEVEGNDVSGRLCIKRSWPGMMRTVYGDHDRFISTYLAQYPGKYFTGDGAYRDADGYYWVTGRIDDVLNVSGHRIGTAEVEGAIVGHDATAEAAVVGFPHETKGQGICVYVLLKEGFDASEKLAAELRDACRDEIGKFAAPDKIQFVSGLPKTRSGKIMRRILRKVAEGHTENLGDITTLADPSVVEDIKTGTTY